MQNNQEDPAKPSTARPRLGRTRFVGIDPAQQQIADNTLPTTGNLILNSHEEFAERTTRTTQKGVVIPTGKLTRSRQNTHSLPGLDDTPVEDQHILHLKQLSGMMRSIRKSGNSTALSLNTTEGDE